jgi:hypothetical protein
MSVDFDWLSNGRPQFLNGRRDDVRALGLIEKKNDEFVAAKPHHRVGRPYAIDHSARDDLEKLVAGVMAEAVVHDLEIIKVDEYHRHPAVVPPRVQQSLRKTVLEQGAVGKPGECVMVGQEMNAIFGLLAFDRDAGNPGGSVDETRFDRVSNWNSTQSSSSALTIGARPN